MDSPNLPDDPQKRSSATILLQALQTANIQHLDTSNTSRHQSPFQQGSTLAPTSHHFASQISKGETTPETISPKDIDLASCQQVSLVRPNRVHTFKEDNDVFETDDEDEIDESAIDDDDDSSDWEVSVKDSGYPSIDEKTFFQRVGSRRNLTSRRSLITTMLHQNDRAAALAHAATTSATV
ncbi:hypothetical protein BJ875DRAFT_444026 [Amylocarpus encephaloides]|uniref:DUF3295 domain-containing protein n=1 Tax=Amylocarpus encephaloides TaxID=45428 RepID=A0A9P8C2Y6_9HELO|nr:hypothetical protein BJ875DRAFT_444026 [Amylocarpus encephaloides]